MRRNRRTLIKLFQFLKAKVGTEKELENSLLRLRGRDADISHEASEIQVSFYYSLVSQVLNVYSLLDMASNVTNCSALHRS